MREERGEGTEETGEKEKITWRKTKEPRLNQYQGSRHMNKALNPQPVTEPSEPTAGGMEKSCPY